MRKSLEHIQIIKYAYDDDFDLLSVQHQNVGYKQKANILLLIVWIEIYSKIIGTELGRTML